MKRIIRTLSILSLLVILLGCTTNEPDYSQLSQVDESLTSFIDSGYDINDYDVYMKELGFCTVMTTVTFYVNTENNYQYLVSSGCSEDPLFYVYYENEYYTLNDAVSIGLFYDEDVVTQFIDKLYEHGAPRVD